MFESRDSFVFKYFGVYKQLGLKTGFANIGRNKRSSNLDFQLSSSTHINLPTEDKLTYLALKIII